MKGLLQREHTPGGLEGVFATLEAIAEVKTVCETTMSIYQRISYANLGVLGELSLFYL